jgi:glycosyltransferase involved in cell wall biosynthesis
MRDLAQASLLRSIDHAATKVLEPCDALIAMSGIGVRALDEARRRYGARIFVERSSRHILSQREILERMPGAHPDFASGFRIDRELVSYALADTITVPARHVWESFTERGFSADQLFLNPFGVSLDTFRPTPAPTRQARRTILMTGAWSLRKGCDVLVAAWRRMPGVRLLHVGPRGDVPLPSESLFEHVDAVPQSQLPRYYAQADVFALASREEGLAVVQAQALACGLKLVCTTRTGGADLAPWTCQERSVSVVPPDDPDALAAALTAALQDLPPAGELRDLLGQFRQDLSWPASARRYERRLLAATIT